MQSHTTQFSRFRIRPPDLYSGVLLKDVRETRRIASWSHRCLEWHQKVCAKLNTRLRWGVWRHGEPDNTYKYLDFHNNWGMKATRSQPVPAGPYREPQWSVPPNICGPPRQKVDRTGGRHPNFLFPTTHKFLLCTILCLCHLGGFIPTQIIRIGSWSPSPDLNCLKHWARNVVTEKLRSLELEANGLSRLSLIQSSR